MKLFGAGIASIFLARCQRAGTPRPDGPITCYAPTATFTRTRSAAVLSARDRLRVCWSSFDDLAAEGPEMSEDGIANPHGRKLVAEHRTALDILVEAGELSDPVADLVQEAYNAAVYHAWRSNALITCYFSGGPFYGQDSAAILVAQAEALNEIPAGSAIDPDTLARARLALERDLAFYALSEADLQTLYGHLSANGGSYPPFDELDLEIGPEARAAAQFIVDLLAAP